MMMLSARAVWLRRAAQMGLLVWTATVPGRWSAQGMNLTLAWDVSPDPAAAGYNVYYGTSPRTYTSIFSVGNTNFATVSNLLSGTTYYFAATTYNIAGLESDYSAEVAYTPPSGPQNVAPTLDLIAGVVLNENAGVQTIQLTGISSGSSSENQTLTVSAFSSNPSLIPNPSINYTSPNSTGTLSFTPVPSAFGSSTMTVMVDDGGTVSNSVIRSFAIIVNPVNDPPTLDPIDNIVISQNAGPQTIPLSGISAGNSNEIQTVTITATSSNPALIPDPAVSYTSPNPAGTLRLQPATNAFGSALITVVASDGQPTNSTITRSFSVTVNPVVVVANIITNVTITPNQTFRLALSSPYSNGDRVSFALDSSAPSGAAIINRRGVPILSWTPTSAQAATTNQILVLLTDLTTPALSTNVAALVTVLDYLGVTPLAAAVEAGQTANLPICVSSSDGVTNLSFSIQWPTALLATPALTIPPASKVTGTVQLQGSSVQVNLSSQPKRVMTGSNIVAQLTFQALSGQPSAFLDLPASASGGSKPSGVPYAYSVAQKARVVVVNDRPLLEWAGPSAAGPLKIYGRVGTNYVLQATSNLLSEASWSTALNYRQTNVVQTFAPDWSRALLLYRLKQ